MENLKLLLVNEQDPLIKIPLKSTLTEGTCTDSTLCIINCDTFDPICRVLETNMNFCGTTNTAGFSLSQPTLNGKKHCNAKGGISCSQERSIWGG